MSNKNKYFHYVKLGLELANKIELHQAKIAEYAVKVCDIRHGGKSEGYYTITNYAEDINMPYKTVQNWVQVYRNVVQKLNKNIETKEDWDTARKTNDLLTMKTTIENKNKGTKNTRRTKDTPKSVVQSLFNKINDNEKPFIMELNRITQSSKHALHILKKRDLNIVDTQSLIHLMEILDEASDIINNHLTKKLKSAS